MPCCVYHSLRVSRIPVAPIMITRCPSSSPRELGSIELPHVIMVEAGASKPRPDVSRLNRLTAISKENGTRLVSSCLNRLRGLWGSTAICRLSTWENIRSIL